MKALAAAAPPAAPAPLQAAAPAPEPVFRAALLAPFTGDHRELGTAMLNAAQLALYDAAGEHFVLMPMDTAGAEGSAAEAVQLSLQRGSDVLLGPLLSANVQTAGAAAETRGVPVFAFSNDRAALGPGVWLFGPPPEDEVERLVGHAAANGLHRLGLLALDTKFGRHVLEAAQRAARRHGVAIVRHGLLTGDLQPREHSEQVRVFAGAPVTRTKETDELPPPFDAVLIAGQHKQRSTAALLAFHGIDPQRVRYLVAGIRPDALPLDEQSLAGAWYAGPPPEAFDLFARRYEAVYGAPPPHLAGLAYDATALAAMLAEDGGAGRVDMAGLTGAEGFFGAGGFFRFRPDGGVQRALAVFEIAPEGPRIVDPAPERFDTENRPIG